MSETMRPLPFERLMAWALSEYARQGRIFGIPREKFWQNRGGAALRVFGAEIASPLGPAAGPHSQLAQNIVAAYLCGGRFIELKTVQRLDGEALAAAIPRPCIDAADEGYNVEWSTELTVPAAFEEYAKAWLAVHALSQLPGFPAPGGLIFNMSVGYDLSGIQSEKIDAYIECMKNAGGSAVWQSGLAWLQKNGFNTAGISPQISASVTLSTLHGCPAGEIERIARYLLQKKQLHTYVKCNPTLLGAETARRILSDAGYGALRFGDAHFQNDLQYPDAVAMLRRLQGCAAGLGLGFGVKLTNTFPVQTHPGGLAGKEQYLSGRALFPLSVAVAAKLSRSFGGALPISYSGGADAHNIEPLYAAGIAPITVATTLLKPGGYQRLCQLAEKLEPLLCEKRAGTDTAALERLAAESVKIPFYRKDSRPVQSRKTALPLPVFDCFSAPCAQGGCPIGQQVPRYLALVAKQDYAGAFKVIAADNPLPSLTGEICTHACQGKCVRMDYEAPLAIRAAKRLAAEKAQAAFTASLSAPALATEKTAAVVGAGPAGIAAALFLRRAGMAVTVYEKRQRPFGIVEYVIPAFRVSQNALCRDFEMAAAMGVKFRFGREISGAAELRASYSYVILALGAWEEGEHPFAQAASPQAGGGQILDALRFLAEAKAGAPRPLGRRVAVIGGGDVAMDCARAAKRAPGTESVAVVYRRTREFMPASREELELALAEGIELQELCAPLSYNGAELICGEMRLGDWDAGGRRGVMPTGANKAFLCDAVISAVGARADTGFFAAAGLLADGKGLPALSAMNESSIPGVYVAGDCRRGPATVVEAIADAKKIAADICMKNGLPIGFAPAPPLLDAPALYARKGVLAKPPAGTPADALRCLGCDTLCELCCEVCPNRANVRVPVPGFKDASQIVHLDGLCNHCGNCGTFCPRAGLPYKDKFTLFWGAEDFDSCENRGVLRLAGGRVRLRLAGGEELCCAPDDPRLPPEEAALIGLLLREYPYLFLEPVNTAF